MEIKCKVKPVLPEYVKECFWCDGEGRRKQMYTVGCGGGYYNSVGRCDHCKGAGYVYKSTETAVPDSVLAQMGRKRAYY